MEITQALFLDPLSRDEDAPYRGAIELAVSHVQNGHYRKAKKAFESATRLDSDRAQAWLGLALSEVCTSEMDTMAGAMENARELVRKYESKLGAGHDKAAHAMIWTALLYHGLDMVGEYLDDIGRAERVANNADIERDLATTVAGVSISAARRSKSASGSIAGYGAAGLAVARSAALRDKARRLRKYGARGLGECMALLEQCAEVVQLISGVADDGTIDAASSAWCTVFRRALVLSVSDRIVWFGTDRKAGYVLERIRSSETKQQLEKYRGSLAFAKLRMVMGAAFCGGAGVALSLVLDKITPTLSPLAIIIPVIAFLISDFVRQRRRQSDMIKLLASLSADGCVLHLLRETPNSSAALDNGAAALPESGDAAAATCTECGALANRSNRRCIYCMALLPWAANREPSSYKFSVDDVEIDSPDPIFKALPACSSSACTLDVGRESKDDGSYTNLNICGGQRSDLVIELEHWTKDAQIIERYRLNASRAATKKVVQMFFDCEDGLDKGFPWVRE